MSGVTPGINAEDQSVRQMLDGQKYGIGFYQREYRWERKHIEDILHDLETSFFESYDPEHRRADVEGYSHYFLGPTIINKQSDSDYIIDGQQRLTTLTLLLIHLIHLQEDEGIPEEDQVNLHSLVFSERYGDRSFNLQVDEREECMEALYNHRSFDTEDASESVQNIVKRYEDIIEIFPEDLKGRTLLYFIDWLRDNVDLVKISTYSDDDAYKIFEAMNDRGLQLNPTEMLKGYLLANLIPSQRPEANKLWKDRILQLIEIDKDEELDFFKSWLRSQYAESMRSRRKGAENKDFEIIGTAYHKWVRENEHQVGLADPDDYREFINVEFDMFSRYYVELKKASQSQVDGMEHVFYNSNVHFTLQYPLILAPIRSDDDRDIVERKIRLVSKFLDIFIARRIVNRKAIYRSAVEYTMFNLVKDIRDLDVLELADILKTNANDMDETFDAVSNFYMHQQNKSKVHHLLARITSHIEKESGMESRFEEYVTNDIEHPYQVEHIWADKYERFAEEFETEEDFMEYRNRIGCLLLLPKNFNQSYGDDPYEEKVDNYFGQNLLAKSLNERCYERNPGFLSYKDKTGLPFDPHAQFWTEDVDARQELIRQLCEEVWSTEALEQEVSDLR